MSSAGVRWGQWRMSGAFADVVKSAALADKWGDLTGLFEFNSKVIVLRADDHVAGDFVQYWGISPLFDKVGEGENIPSYGINFLRVKFCRACGSEDVAAAIPDSSEGGSCNACGVRVDAAGSLGYKTKFQGVEKVRDL